MIHTSDLGLSSPRDLALPLVASPSSPAQRHGKSSLIAHCASSPTPHYNSVVASLAPKAPAIHALGGPQIIAAPSNRRPSRRAHREEETRSLNSASLPILQYSIDLGYPRLRRQHTVSISIPRSNVNDLAR